MIAVKLKCQKMMTRDKINFADKIHGGHIMNLLNKVPYTCAYCVTLSVDQFIFKQSIFVGELITDLATVNYVGHTSMKIDIKVLAEGTARVRYVTPIPVMTMVAMDEFGKSKAAPELELLNNTKRYHHQEAKLHRAYINEHAGRIRVINFLHNYH